MGTRPSRELGEANAAQLSPGQGRIWPPSSLLGPAAHRSWAAFGSWFSDVLCCRSTWPLLLWVLREVGVKCLSQKQQRASRVAAGTPQVKKETEETEETEGFAGAAPPAPVLGASQGLFHGHAGG